MSQDSQLFSLNADHNAAEAAFQTLKRQTAESEFEKFSNIGTIEGSRQKANQERPLVEGSKSARPEKDHDSISNELNKKQTKVEDPENGNALKLKRALASSSHLSAEEQCNIQKLKFDLQIIESKNNQGAGFATENQALS